MMSIRALALDLYRAKQRVDQLEKEMETVSADQKSERDEELRIAQKELALLRRMLEGEKDSGDFRKRFSGFGRT